MTVHNLGGRRIETSGASRNFFFYRRQGVRIEVDPKRNWWCLWLCSSTSKIDAIECDVVLDGLAGPVRASGDCTNCGKLTVWGPSFWGFNVPRPYDRADYQGVVTIGGERFGFGGTVLF